MSDTPHDCTELLWRQTQQMRTLAEHHHRQLPTIWTAFPPPITVPLSEVTDTLAGLKVGLDQAVIVWVLGRPSARGR